MMLARWIEPARPMPKRATRTDDVLDRVEEARLWSPPLVVWLSRYLENAGAHHIKKEKPEKPVFLDSDMVFCMTQKYLMLSK